MTVLDKPRQSHGTGQFRHEDFCGLGEDVVFEAGVLVFHPEKICIGKFVYIGHNTILKGYYNNTMQIGESTWIGQQCFFHSGGGLTIGRNVGIGPGVKIITSFHQEEGRHKPILHSHIEFAPVQIDDDCDLGIGAIVLPGVTIAKGVQVGAGAVVSQDLPPYAVAAGIPARVVRMRQ